MYGNLLCNTQFFWKIKKIAQNHDINERKMLKRQIFRK